MKRFWAMVAAGALAAVTVAAGTAVPPAPPAGKTRVLPQWAAIKDDGSARALVSAMEGTAPVSCPEPGVVAMPVVFSHGIVSRANWDFKVGCDLRMCKGIQFDFYCGDFSPFTNFSIYFRSGNGWYHAAFAPEEAGRWQRIVVNKAEASTESPCSGWGEISTVRVSGWRGGTNDTVVAIANLALAGGEPDVLVLRADSQMASAGSEAKGLSVYAENVSLTLDALGVDSAQIADTDLTADLLERTRLVVLPYNPDVPDKVANLLKPFVKRGGQVMAFYILPARVETLLGIRYVRTRRSNEGPAFLGFERNGAGLAGQPEFAPQESWCATVAVPTGEGSVAAWWREQAGNGSAKAKLPAVTVTPTGAFFGHVWFGGARGPQMSLMRSVVAKLVPDIWEKSARKAYAEIGRGLEPAAAGGVAATEKAEQLAKTAKERLDAGDWLASIEASGEASTAAVRAWLAAQKPGTANEHRAFWCHSAWGLGGGLDWDSSIKFLKENGFNVLLPNMCWGGVAFYESRVLPVSPLVAERGDALKACLVACKKYGVQCHVWKVCWNMGTATDEAFVKQMAAEGRTQKMFNGKAQERWLCPSDPRNQSQEVAAMVELATQFPVDGIHFDYIRYPEEDACFCDGCRKRFEERLGRKLAKWPQDTRDGGETEKAWNEFRRGNISTVVQRVAEAVHGKSGVKISAAVFRNPESDPDTIAQDWPTWCRKGWLDFACPMDYVDSVAMFRNMATNQAKAVGRAKLYPGIGLSCWKNPRDPVLLARQIEAVRELGFSGFTVFNFDGCAEAVLPDLHLGVTR